MRGLMRKVALVLGLAFVASAGASEPVVVASSLSKEVLVVYKKAFEKRYPEFRLEYVNFPGTNTISFLKDRKSGARPDVFWGSSPDSFRTLHSHGLLQPVAAEPAGSYYRSQALSGYGIMWNTRYLRAHALPVPAQWSDLGRAEYSGHVVMSSPSRSGTTHSIVESVLQGLGWQAGWQQILQIAGNCATITERSFGVPNSVNSGRIGIGLVVDFLALSGKYSGLPVDFAYAWPSLMTTASIGLLKDAGNPSGGEKFIEFTLSEEGQRLLLTPAISRLPVSPSVFASSTLPRDYPQLLPAVRRPPADYDLALSESRYLAVGIIFDQMVTFRHPQLTALTQAMQAAQKMLDKKPDPTAREWLRRAYALAYQAPVSGTEDWVLHGPGKDASGKLSNLALKEAELGQRVTANYREASALTRQALALLQSL